jgi:hypothetical protein
MEQTKRENDKTLKIVGEKYLEIYRNLKCTYLCTLQLYLYVSFFQKYSCSHPKINGTAYTVSEAEDIRALKLCNDRAVRGAVREMRAHTYGG